MSTFTSRSASQEIPRQFYSSLKKHIFDRLRELSQSAEWSAVPDAVKNWSSDTKQEEMKLYLDKNPTARNNYRFTVLRAVKTLQQSEGNTSMRMRAQDLDRIDLEDFFFTMFRDIVCSPDVSDLSAFKSLRPSDRELLTEEIYRTNLYQVVYDMRNRLVGGESRVSSRSKLPPRAPSVKSSRRSAASRRTIVSKRPAPIVETPPVAAPVPDIRADDSASCAPSEVVSRVGGGLDAQILSLHQKKLEENKEPVRVEATPIVVSITEDKTPTVKKPETVLDLDVPSRSTRRSKFTREPSRKKKPLSFFDTEVSRRTVLSRSEVE